ncbi:hypothetical protein BCR42DRAFT_426102 [Absidia repens]|uniref:Uncharacterized protein n=1 Tax=Absidia repens TaxID=90262 RepID=A0A1X2I1H4_9FUNG|nr:hypothetical protein BCR42DRAFT_426102 [Absidia repens]
MPSSAFRLPENNTESTKSNSKNGIPCFPKDRNQNFRLFFFFAIWYSLITQTRDDQSRMESSKYFTICRIALFLLMV